MFRRLVITLYAVEGYEKNEYGVLTPVESVRDVPCLVESVARAEFTQAGQLGHTPTCTAVVSSMAYQGEDKAELDGDIYNIYRTYERNRNETELYLEKTVGVHGED